MAPSPTLAPILHSRLPASSTLAAQDPVWLLVRLAVTPHTHAEQDIAICSTPQIAIYNAVCMMDKLTNRQFRHCPYGLLSAVAASLDVHESDVMFRMTEKRGRANSIGFRRFPLDPTFQPTEDPAFDVPATKPRPNGEASPLPQARESGGKTQSKKRSGLDRRCDASEAAAEWRDPSSAPSSPPPAPDSIGTTKNTLRDLLSPRWTERVVDPRLQPL